MGVREVDDVAVSGDDFIWPMDGPLPMGVSRARYFTLTATNYEFSLVPELAGSHLLSDRGGTWVIRRGGCDCARWVYVDNLGVIGPGVQWVEQVLDSAKRSFDGDGLELHEVEFFTRGGSSLGIVIDLELFQTRNTAKRYATIKEGINALLSMWKGRGWVVEVILGHCNYFGLVSRENLSRCYDCYRFVSLSYFEASVLWPSARRELEAFKGLMILVAGEWSWQWSREEFMVDTSLTGYCIEKSIWSHVDVSSVGRIRERGRYKMGGEKSS